MLPEAKKAGAAEAECGTGQDQTLQQGSGWAEALSSKVRPAKRAVPSPEERVGSGRIPPVGPSPATPVGTKPERLRRLPTIPERASYCLGLRRPMTRKPPLRLKHLILGLTFPTIMAFDVVTKRWALDALGQASSELFGGLLPLTLAFNKGAAFGVRLGEDSRWFFVPVTIVALFLLAVLFRQAADRDFLRITAISLVVSGAIGNLYDRVRWDQGVIDFLGPVDLGFWLFPIFNVADMAITCGAVLLAVSFWFEEQEERRAEEEGAAASAQGAPVADELSEEPTSS